MPSAAVHAAFKARLLANWDTAARPVVSDISVAEPPEGKDAWVVIQYPVVNGVRPVLGHTYFEEGAARLVLNVVNQIDVETALGWVDTLAGLFRGLKPRDFSGIETGPVD